MGVAIGRRSKWTPGSSAKLNASHPLSAGLIRAWIGRDPCRVTGKAGFAQFAAGVIPGLYGPAVDLGLAPSANFTLNTDLSSGPDCTVTLVAMPTVTPSTSAYQMAFEYTANGGGTSGGFYVAWRQGDAFALAATNSAGGYNGTGFAPAAFEATITGMSLRMKGPTPLASVYRNGVLHADLTGTNGASNLATNTLFVGNRNNTSLRMPMAVWALYVHNRAISGAEHAQLAADPFCMVR